MLGRYSLNIVLKRTRLLTVFAETLHLKSEVGRSPFPSPDISINMTYRSVEICFASIMQASVKPCRVLSFFPPVFLFFVFTPTEFTVTELCDDNAGT